MHHVTTPPLLTDQDVTEAIGARRAVAWMREAVLAAEDGRLRAPARTAADLGGGRLVFTTGSLDGEWFGYRSYDTFDVASGRSDQVVVVQSRRTGRVRGIAVGNALGQIRTGALGGVAADLLARADATSLGVIGAGPQAWRQVWAIAAVRDLTAVSVHSRTAGRAEDFADRVRRELRVDAAVHRSAEAAVRGRDIVVLATTSPTSVIDPDWLGPGAHVTTVGPKQRGAAEFGLDLADRADVLVTDSLAQLHAYEPASIVSTSHHADRVRSLGAVATGASHGRRGERDLTLYLSVGLAGTEAHLLDRLLAHRAGHTGTLPAT
ncbi:MAG TPA: hypothetical protein VFT70_10575 [Nocardioides sp.]|nr:hypothetical protein [Nocardioides sp.]